MDSNEKQILMNILKTDDSFSDYIQKLSKITKNDIRYIRFEILDLYNDNCGLVEALMKISSKYGYNTIMELDDAYGKI